MSALNKSEHAFRAAFLITGSVCGGVFAVVRASEDGSGNALFESAVRAAVAWSGRPDASPEQVPEELRRVLRLPRLQRLCYVLRILEGLAAGKCSLLIGLPEEEVNATAVAAAVALASGIVAPVQPVVPTWCEAGS